MHTCVCVCACVCVWASERQRECIKCGVHMSDSMCVCVVCMFVCMCVRMFVHACVKVHAHVHMCECTCVCTCVCVCVYVLCVCTAVCPSLSVPACSVCRLQVSIPTWVQVLGHHGRGGVATTGRGADDGGVSDGQPALTFQRLDGHPQVIQLRVLRNSTTNQTSWSEWTTHDASSGSATLHSSSPLLVFYCRNKTFLSLPTSFWSHSVPPDIHHIYIHLWCITTQVQTNNRISWVLLTELGGKERRISAYFHLLAWKIFQRWAETQRDRKNEELTVSLLRQKWKSTCSMIQKKWKIGCQSAQRYRRRSGKLSVCSKIQKSGKLSACSKKQKKWKTGCQFAQRYRRCGKLSACSKRQKEWKIGYQFAQRYRNGKLSACSVRQKKKWKTVSLLRDTVTLLKETEEVESWLSAHSVRQKKWKIGCQFAQRDRRRSGKLSACSKRQKKKWKTVSLLKEILSLY